MNRDELVADIRESFERSYVGAVHRSCLYWADHTCRELAHRGYVACLQAGSASWPMLRPEQDDGESTTLTHFSYVFEPEKWRGPRLLLVLARGILPEMHCWVWVVDKRSPYEGFVVDLTTRYLPQQAMETAGIHWPADGVSPPDYVWHSPEEIPDGMSYRADRYATAMALRILGKL